MKILRRTWRWVKKRFDKAFYRSRGGQFVWLLGLVGLFGLLGYALVRITFVNVDIWRVVELMLDPGSFVDSSKDGNVSAFVQLIIAIFGAVVFTSLLINAFGNWLDRRIDAYKNGEVIYSFDDHILILGVNSMLLNILKSLVKLKENRNRDIVVLTSGNAEELRNLINSEIEPQYARNIYVVYGNRLRKEMLQRLDADETKSIYILGSEEEVSHDASNLLCYNTLKELCASSKNPIKCYMVLESLSSIQNFYYKQDSASTKQLHLTLINSLENTAQRVLVSREYKDGILYPALDRNGITTKSEQAVHFVIVGMSQMAYAMAMTAAHICHYPNFKTKGLKTKITFIQDDIRQEMDFFMGRYCHMMDLSYATYVDLSNPENNAEFFPKEEYLEPGTSKYGFLDVEWEFVNGGIESAAVRKYIEDCVKKDGAGEYLSLAFCDSKSEQNVAASLYLPTIVYEKQIPVFVYQPGGEQVMLMAREAKKYTNVYPFGMRSDCYDKQYFDRIKKARRIRHLYSLVDDNIPFVSMPADATLETSWFDIQYAFQQSNLYAANSIPGKLRSIGYDAHRDMTPEEVDILSETEHNRWNMERLLLGFSAYKYADRKRFLDILCGEDAEAKSECKDKLNVAKKVLFKHKDIAPYDELPENVKDYDKGIVKYLPEVMK